MPATDRTTLIKKSRHLLWFQVQHKSDGTIRVSRYDVDQTLTLPHNKSLLAEDTAEACKRAISRKGQWKSEVSSTGRIIAQIVERPTPSFFLHYYSIGVQSDRLASYFILDALTRQPELPGNFDWQEPVTVGRIQEFFNLKRHSPEWSSWANSTTSFKTIHQFEIVLRLREEDKEYIGLDVNSELHQYPYGRLIGGLPFGAEDRFLAICKLDEDEPNTWKAALENHKELFIAWNVICRKGSKLMRIFIEGEPGSGKELWVEAIKEGSGPHRKGGWQTLSATLPTEDLKSLLYGERSGVLERPGFLASCADGGVFVDEIGKSDQEFRKDLLRVLEAKEFVPRGGLPTSIKNVLFIFASTRVDRTNAHDPPDFWTRMDVELSLPEPIKLMPPPKRDRPRLSPFLKNDEARFHALLGNFWFVALKEQLNDMSADEDVLLKDFVTNVFKPILDVLVKESWPRYFAKGIPVSPRRIRSLANTLASEHQWLGYKIDAKGSNIHDRSSARKSYDEFRRRFVKDFLRQLVQDEKNRMAVAKETEKRRRQQRELELSS